VEGRNVPVRHIHLRGTRAQLAPGLHRYMRQRDRKVSMSSRMQDGLAEELAAWCFFGEDREGVRKRKRAAAFRTRGRPAGWEGLGAPESGGTEGSPSQVPDNSAHPRACPEDMWISTASLRKSLLVVALTFHAAPRRFTYPSSTNLDTLAGKRPRTPASPSAVADSVASSSLLGESCSVPSRA